MDDVSGLQNRTKDKIEEFVRRPNSYVEPRSRQYIFSCHDTLTIHGRNIRLRNRARQKCTKAKDLTGTRSLTSKRITKR